MRDFYRIGVKTFSVLCISAAISGCATDQSGNTAQTGTEPGVHTTRNHVVAGLASLIGGETFGSSIGNMLDNMDRKALARRQQQLLMAQGDNRTVTWQSDHSTMRATITTSNTRQEDKSIRIVRNADVAAPGSIHAIGARYQVTSSSPVYLSPSTSATVAMTLPTHSVIMVVGQLTGQNWMLVSQHGRSIGYVAASSLQPLSAGSHHAATSGTFDLDAAPAAPEGKTVSSNVNASVTCRDLKTVATDKGKSSTSTETACRSAQGVWELN
ncbi:hypothetical protein NO263_06750 [Gluconacetobacter entanii]|uniref:SH3 domain-containing protein n=1 Tax=Gluconacetobacter entanii TaxID=108528 RepID=A0ABT3K4H1_9PROT|nr:hypothetical protein [Gluconacetobacter entanii]MCE2577695.1 hypothetical protein [Komagataeibacter sp. FNDCR1]MCW4590276.1 hypothetical protein [Gluconacetobacter entanii]MCW4593845.1 hypothetical protein [Gluconacetobacter entanii]NPC88645.1 hypothetical protein [Gluconacetobacter entanii]